MVATGPSRRLPVPALVPLVPVYFLSAHGLDHLGWRAPSLAELQIVGSRTDTVASICRRRHQVIPQNQRLSFSLSLSRSLASIKTSSSLSSRMIDALPSQRRPPGRDLLQKEFAASRRRFLSSDTQVQAGELPRVGCASPCGSARSILAATPCCASSCHIAARKRRCQRDVNPR